MIVAPPPPSPTRPRLATAFSNGSFLGFGHHILVAFLVGFFFWLTLLLQWARTLFPGFCISVAAMLLPTPSFPPHWNTLFEASRCVSSCPSTALGINFFSFLLPLEYHFLLKDPPPFWARFGLILPGIFFFFVLFYEESTDYR
jgi:hypothetical protein